MILISQCHVSPLGPASLRKNFPALSMTLISTFSKLFGPYGDPIHDKESVISPSPPKPKNNFDIISAPAGTSDFYTDV